MSRRACQHEDARTPRAIAGLAALALIAVPSLRAQDRAPAPARQPAEKPAARSAGAFRVECRVTVPDGAQVLELWVPAPRMDEFQTVTATDARAPSGGVLEQQTDPEHANTFLHVRAQAPRGTIAFQASWTFERREAVRAPFRRSPRTDRDAEGAPRTTPADLAPSQLVPLAGRLKARAALIAPDEEDALNLARAIFDEVLRTLVRSTKGEGIGRGDALWALDAGHGDATDFAALFVGLARARGVPARFHLGFLLPEGQVGAEAESPGHTAWAEFFVPDLGWIPVDLDSASRWPRTRQYAFGNLHERRIHVTSGRDVRLAPEGRLPPRNFVIYPHAEIDGEQAPVAHRFTFKEHQEK
jgi:transglutaminase-like putative cysteine protease